MSPEKMEELVRQLKEASPAPVSAELGRRIEEGLRREARRRVLARIRSSAGWAGMAVAASLLITFGFLLFNGRLSLPDVPSLEPSGKEAMPVGEPGSEQSYHPVLTENNLHNRVDEGIVFLRGGLTARRYRYQFLDRVVWENPEDGSVVELQVPRDEVVLVPVQTF